MSRESALGSREPDFVDMARSLSEWADVDEPTHKTTQPMQMGSPYGIHLMNLHTSMRQLMCDIQRREHQGVSTGALQQELEIKRAESRVFLLYLETHANATAGSQGGSDRAPSA